ncbi:MAG TPA: leucyl aminopeptidase family protein [Jatrophihabitans sp.]|jgi:leucyl aminopeptidase|uniref:leucyl aminopeptidase family protein n=1 Tax=Jatrophihabitans sp. TaxID=1932789 RepID=UPI002DFF222D|nr:leucyl aminopeptidase family protein [Jatrophihabitans sp.]
MLEFRCTPSDPSARALDIPADPAAARGAAGALARDLADGPSTVAVDGLDGARLAAVVEGLALGAHRLSGGGPTVVELAGADSDAGRSAVERGRDAAAATLWARTLANTPADTATPAWLAAQAERELAPLGVQVTVREPGWLAEHGFAGVLAVGGGSASPPRLIEASWQPSGARGDVHPIVVGKGITFDTGGVNRKVGEGMRTMHTDMAGGAAALAALRLVASRRLPVRLTVLVPAAENALSGSSYRPGDVIRHYGGRTSEIANTDAEGRIVLADALAYAAARLHPSALVDIATLTGAVKVALGLRTAGVFATSDAVADGLVAAGAVTGEPLWRLPLPTEYESTLQSSVADATNAPGNPGAITAALFLRHFAGGVPWAHLDIAGTARAPADDGLLSRGATGFGARLLADWVESLA